MRDAQAELIFENSWKIEDEGVRIFILAGAERALVIDSGRSGLDVRYLAEKLVSLPLELLNTHADPDHTAGNSGFQTFLMHPSEAAVYYKLHNGAGSFLPVYDGDVIDLGGRQLEVVHIPGHTPGSISVLDRSRRCLIGGDPIQCHGQIYMFGIHRDLHSYVHGLKKLLTRTDFDLIYPSHADLPVERDIIPELIAEAESILAGKGHGSLTAIHGRDVMAYDAGRNVLLCDKPH
ncbi:MAG: MBL fold metallo-hydrolase [Oscillospiraceae bacterium]|nr:MBL fold metallo-hydrolase [Oscillospiraceae bacterium]